MEDSIDDIIDLCDSFILADHHALTNVLIELDTDDSVVLDLDNSIVDLPHSESPTSSNTSIVTQSRNSLRNKENDPSALIKHKQKTKLKSKKIKHESLCKEVESKFGDCPICFDPLGQNPLASTKCGHVYCMKCLQQYLKFDQRCPTCRQILRGKSSYHPLYLNK